MMRRTVFATALVILMGLLIAGCSTATQEEAADLAAPAEQAAATVIKDLVCGMTVDPDSAYALTYEYEGETYYFCSEPCLETFKADPESYIQAGGNMMPDQHIH